MKTLILAAVLLLTFVNAGGQIPGLCVVSDSDSLKSDTIDIEIDMQDILVFDFTGQDIFLVESYDAKEIYKDRNMIVLRNRWRRYGSSHINKRFRFTQCCDTMSIEVNCGQEANFYFKNMKFRKGNHKIRIEDNKYDIQNLIKAEKITCDRYLNNLFLKNAYRDHTIKEGRYFKHLDFYEFDMQDENQIKWETLIFV